VTPRLVDAAELADVLGTSTAYVYAHAAELGAYRLGMVGEGKKPRLRFDVERALAAISPASPEAEGAPPEPEAGRPSRTKRRGSTAGSLLTSRPREVAGHE